MTSFCYNYLYSAYVDNTTFFLKDTISVNHMIDTFHFFSYFSGLKPNLRKSKIVCIGVLKGVQVTVCGMRCIDLNIDTLKNIRYPFLLQQKIERGKKKL